MKKTAVTIPIAILSMAVMVWWKNSDIDDPKVSAAAIGPGAVSAIQKPGLLTDAEPSGEDVNPADSSPVSAAKRITRVPQGKPTPDKTTTEYDSLMNITAENFDDFSRQNLDRALAGDLEAGKRIVDLPSRCNRTYKNEQEFEQYMERMLSSLQSRRESNPGGTYQTDDEFFREQWSRYRSCRKQADFFSDTLRSRLDQLAEQGNVVARFMYATWPLDDLGEADAFVKMQEWETKSLEYSLLNLEQGETAGFLAFAYAYGGGNLFTAKADDLGFAFFKAAFDCGFVNSESRMMLQGFFNLEDLPKDQRDRLSITLAKAEYLASYCG